MPLAVRNWHKFQHYKDRQPVWVKLYTELLDDVRFLALPDAAKGQLCTLFLLAAKRGNVLPDKPNTLRVLIGCTGKLYLQELLSGGWLTSDPNEASAPASADASNPASTDASASRARAHSREGEGEKEVEKETTPPPARAAFLDALPKERRHKWAALLHGWSQGLGTPNGKPFAVEHIDAGLLEYLASNPTPDFSPQHVQRFVEKCSTRKPLPASRSGGTGSFLDLVTEEGAA